MEQEESSLQPLVESRQELPPPSHSVDKGKVSIFD